MKARRFTVDDWKDTEDAEVFEDGTDPFIRYLKSDNSEVIIADVNGFHYFQWEDMRNPDNFNLTKWRKLLPLTPRGCEIFLNGFPSNPNPDDLRAIGFEFMEDEKVGLHPHILYPGA